MRRYITILLFAISSLARCQQDSVIICGDSGITFYQFLHNIYWTPDSISFYHSDFQDIPILHTGQPVIFMGDTIEVDSLTLINGIVWTGDTDLFQMPQSNLESFPYLYWYAEQWPGIKNCSVRSLEIIYKKR